MFDWRSPLTGLRSRLKSSAKAKHQASSEALDRQLIYKLSLKKLPGWRQLRQFWQVFSVADKRNFLIGLAVLVLAVIGLITNWYFSATVAEPDYGGSYTEGLIGTPTYVNPLLAPINDVDRDLSQLIFSGLMKVSPDGQLVPDIATSYSISEDGKTYVFELRDDVRWHDGQLLTPDDVVSTIETIQDPEFKSPLRLSFSGVTVEALSQSSVKLQLQQPFPGFLTSLTVGDRKS